MSFLEGLLWLTLNVYHEARGEPEIGKLAVAHVTLNRANQKHQSLGEIVNAPYQFSWTQDTNSFFPHNPEAFFDCAAVSLKALTTPDFTNGATFYHHVDVAPAWAQNMKFLKTYGAHRFYKKNKKKAKTSNVASSKKKEPVKSNIDNEATP